MMNCCSKTCAKTLAAMGVIAYAVCHFWGLALPESVQALHADLLKVSVLGWTGMNVSSFLLGAVQWAVWGWLIGTVFMALSGRFGRKCCGEKRNGA